MVRHFIKYLCRSVVARGLTRSTSYLVILQRVFRCPFSETFVSVYGIPIWDGMNIFICCTSMILFHRILILQKTLQVSWLISTISVSERVGCRKDERFLYCTEDEFVINGNQRQDGG